MSNDRWDSTRCGNPTAITYNVKVIEHHAPRRVGSVMVVCASEPLPDGWVVTDRRWDPTRCGHPTAQVDNVMTIMRRE